MSRQGSSGSGNRGGGDDSIYRIPPYFYLHVLDQNSNVTRVEVGPKTFIRQDNERVVYGPERMITIPPRHYCIIENPVHKNDKGEVQFHVSGQVKLLHADQDIRLAQDPFPLYPGETVKGAVTPLKVVVANSALRLRALLDFKDDRGNEKVAGDEWLFEGPGTYIPRKEVVVEETIRATIVKPNQAIRLRARKETTDRDGNARVTGEEWLSKKCGAYLPGAYEEVIDVVNAYVLTEKKALHMTATRTFTDDYKVERKNGEEWLITMKDTETHIPHVYEEVVGVVKITTLTNRQYCIILDPVDADGKPQLGRKKLIKGEKSFFLMPGEHLERGIQNVHVLGEDEGLILRATEDFFDDDKKIQRQPGDKWMIRGPKEYVPPVEVEVVTKRQAIPLDENEGIYVRDVKSGKVRAITGETYMLNQDEELWSKELPPAVETLLAQNKDPLADRSDRSSTGHGAPRDKTKVVSFRVPHNAAVQIYDYKEKKARVVFGPELVMLRPDEQFTQLSLSGGKPKKPNVIKSLCLLMGPDFCTDIVIVETADHARLSLQLSYNWHFEVTDKTNDSESAKLFSVPDFVGDACKAIASRVRGAVASVQFDDFHKNSARIIRASVFGFDDQTTKVRERFTFAQNNLVITSIDIQSVEPVDQRTRDALMKSVQLAIEITTNSQEATAKHEAERLEQEARGRLERQKIADEAEAERSRKELLELQANSAAVESTGQAKAEAQSRAEAARIEGEAAVEQAKLKAQAMKIEAESELERLTQAREAEMKFVKEQNDLELAKSAEMAAITTKKFKDQVDAIGADTIRAIATAGPELQVKLLQGLGLKTTLITDGTSPVNLFNTAHGLLGGGAVVSRKSKRSKDDDDDDDDDISLS
ncbi:major vault protein-like [Tubulanus polymorphus]|uniref:major vault protein-like n=1 Tax=Tubulanus polymorphus TaxID=672921 RepID=UPI003DA34CD2